MRDRNSTSIYMEGTSTFVKSGESFNIEGKLHE